MKNYNQITSKLYTTEASKSKEKVVEELKVPDPDLSTAKQVLDGEEEEDADTEGNDGTGSP